MEEKNFDLSPQNQEDPIAEEKEAVVPQKSPLAQWLERNRSGVIPLALSFLFPFCILFVCLAFQGMYPFGDQQIINYDGWHQYYPFLLKLWDHFREGTSLLYDWSMGMGTNFLSMLSYYGASPLNLLILFAPVREFRLLFMLLIVVRFGLSGLFMGMFLKKTVKNPGWSVPFFASGYALCSFLLGYFWNNMWLDTVALFPLLCLGFVKLFRESKCSLYVLALSLSLFANYYIGYMSCVAMVLAFVSFCVIDGVRFSDFIRKGFRLLFATLLSAGLSAVMILPALLGLLSTASTQDATSMYVSFYESIRDLLAPLVSFHEPAVMDGLPNITTAAIFTLFSFSFLWAKKVGFRKKIVCFFLLIFLVFSMNFSVLNYIWHGFHYTNMIPYRFAYIFSFLVVAMAYYYYKKAVDAFDWIDAVGMLMFAVLTAFCAFGYYENWSILATVAVLAVAMVLCAFYAGGIVPRQAFSLGICLVLLVELCANTWLGTRAVGTTSYSGYFDLTTGAEVQSLVDQTKEIEQDSFYRLECTEWRSLNDSCFYDYNGISQFSSSANRDVSAFLLGLGMPADPGSNRFVYVYGTPFSNTLLGVKYVISKTGYLSDTTLRCISPSSNEQTAALYEDTSFSGLGFMVADGAQDFTFDMTLRPYERQNALFTALTGLEGDLFSPILPTSSSHTNLTVTDLGNDSYEFVGDELSQDQDTSRVLRFTYKAPKTGMVYVYADVPMSNYMQVNNNWHCIEDYPNLYSAGYFTENEEFQLRTVLQEEGTSSFTGTASYDVVTMDDQLWQKGLSLLQDEQMQVLNWGDNRLEATVCAKTDGYLYTSVPFENDGCWEVKVDGERVEILPFAEAFIGIPLQEGEHRIEMKYKPLGFVPGAWSTALCLVLFGVLWVWERKGGKLFPEKPHPIPVLETELPEETENRVSGENMEAESPSSLQGEEHDHTETDVHYPQGN